MATVNFTSAEFAVGFAGSVSTTKNAARIYGEAFRTIWAGFITGTEALLTATSNSGSSDGLVLVSIDGGSFTAASRSGSIYTLFTGLSQATRLIMVRYANSSGAGAYIASSGDVLTVTGDPAELAPFQYWAQVRDGNSLTAYSVMTASATADYTPLYNAASSGTTNGSNVGCIKIRGAFNYLVACGRTASIFVSKNGALATRYDLPSTDAISGVLVSGLGGDLATYYVWNAGTTFSQLAVSGDVALQDCGLKRRLDQYGDSITQGNISGTSRGEVDTMSVAAAIGFVGSTNGVAGHDVADCEALIDTVTPGREISSADVAILATGRNDTGSLPQATYESCINKLLAAGYGTVLCRGILPESSETWVTPNGVIQAAVAAVADPNVIFIDTSSWSGIATSDSVHPTAAGYQTIVDYAIPAYSAALELEVELIVAAISLGLTFDAPSLVQQNALSVADADIAIAMDNLALQQANALAVSAMDLMIGMDGVVLTQAASIAVGDMALSVAVDNLALVQAGALVVADLSISIASDSVALTQDNLLALGDLAIGLSLDGLVLTPAGVLAVADIGIASSIDSVLLVQAHLLVVGDLSVALAADAVALVLDSAIVVADSVLSVSMDSVVVDQSNLLVVAPLDLAISADSPVLLQQNALSINDMQLSILMDSMTIGGGVFVTESALGFMVRDFQYVLLVEA